VASQPAPLADQIVRWTKPGLDEHETRQKKYDESYGVYRALAATNKGGSAWQSKLRVPYGMQVVDTELVNIVGGKPRVKIRPRTADDERSAKAMQQVIDYYMAEDHFVEKQPSFVQQGLIYGSTAAKNHWLYQTCMKPGRQQVPGPNGEPVFVPTDPKEYVERDGPTFEPWDIYNCWWDPDARDVDSARYVILRSYVTKDDIRRLAVNEEDGTGIYWNTEELLKAGFRKPESETRQSTFNKGEKNKDKLELWEVWRETDDGLRLTVIGNRQIVLRDGPTPYWHGKKPVVIAQVRPDLFDMAGIPETELVDHLQQALWSVQNMRMDNLHLTVMRGITYREGGVTDPNQLELRPRFKWPVQDHDDINFVAPAPLPPEAYREEENLLSRMQLVTGINPFVSGSDMAGVDQNTATGVTALQEVASRLLRFKAAQIQQKGYQRTYEQWSQLIQQLLDKELAVRIEGPGDTFTWEHYGPAEIAGNYDIILEGSEESLSRQQERSEAVALLNAFAPFLGTGVVNPKPILERIAAAYDFPNAEALFPAPQAGAAPNIALPPGVQGGQQQDPTQLLGGQQLDPRALQAMQGGR